ncbi:MAG: precorrin-6y C5,15-methyltransferase (decarboxylating) subunit CbiE [Clostridiales bacterium]|nr:precorrin-6y C5,15-methyltransferase (decarboxylating) subunit CbiE [Clostridiales bacterium]
MDGKVFIVGIGPGNEKYILPKAVSVMEQSDIVVGFQRAVDSLKFISGEKMVVKKLSSIMDVIDLNGDKNISIAASGDPLYYGITEYLKKNYRGNMEIVPGISSFQYMMAKIKLSWQGAFLGSLHGRQEDFCNVVRENKISIWFTDNVHSPNYMCRALESKSIAARVYVGENLSYQNERITVGDVEEMKNKKFAGLSVVVIEKKGESL